MNRDSFKNIQLVMIVFFLLTLLIPLGNMLINIQGEDLKSLLTSPAFFHVLGNSLTVTSIATLISVGLALILAWCLSRTCIRGKGILMALLTLPMLIPSISHGMGLVILFGAKGFFSNLFQYSFNLYGFQGILIGSVLYTLPVAMLMLHDAFTYESKSLYEAGKTLGFSKINEITQITLPYLKKPLISVSFAVFTMIFTDYGVPLAVGGKYRVLSTYMYREVVGLLDFSKGAIVGVILLLPALITFLIDFFNKETHDNSDLSQRILPEKKRFRDLWSSLFTGTIAIFLCIPIIAFTLLSFIRKYPVNMGLTLDNVFEALQMGATDYFLNSLWIAILTALLGSVIAFITAYFTARGKKTISRGILHLVSMVTVAVPGIVLGLGYVVTFNESILYGTMIILVLVNTVHFFASPYLMAYNALGKLNKNFEDAGKTLGISQWRLIRDIILPSTWETLMEMMAYYFINAMITISAISFLSTAETKPLSLMIPVFENQRLFECAAFVSIVILSTNLLMKVSMGIIKKMIQWHLRKV